LPTVLAFAILVIIDMDKRQMTTKQSYYGFWFYFTQRAKFGFVYING
jgi:hypothetical protein